MKRSLLTLSLFLSACGSEGPSQVARSQEPAVQIAKEDIKPPCSGSSLLGVWVINSAHVIFNPDCSWTSDHCGEMGNYSNSSENPAIIDFNVIKSSCSKPSTNACNYAIKSDTLYFNCAAK